MTPKRPHLFQAYLNWIVENDCVPYVLLDANCEGVQVPPHVVNNGEVILSLAPKAVREFLLDAQGLSFWARFAGEPHHIYAPWPGVMSLFAKENERGIFFDEEDLEGYVGGSSEQKCTDETSAKPPHLTVIK